MTRPGKSLTVNSAAVFTCSFVPFLSGMDSSCLSQQLHALWHFTCHFDGVDPYVPHFPLNKDVPLEIHHTQILFDCAPFVKFQAHAHVTCILHGLNSYGQLLANSPGGCLFRRCEALFLVISPGFTFNDLTHLIYHRPSAAFARDCPQPRLLFPTRLWVGPGWPRRENKLVNGCGRFCEIIPQSNSRNAGELAQNIKFLGGVQALLMALASASSLPSKVIISAQNVDFELKWWKWGLDLAVEYV